MRSSDGPSEPWPRLTIFRRAVGTLAATYDLPTGRRNLTSTYHLPTGRRNPDLDLPPSDGPSASWPRLTTFRRAVGTLTTTYHLPTGRRNLTSTYHLPTGRRHLGHDLPPSDGPSASWPRLTTFRRAVGTLTTTYHLPTGRRSLGLDLPSSDRPSEPDLDLPPSDRPSEPWPRLTTFRRAVGVSRRRLSTPHTMSTYRPVFRIAAAGTGVKTRDRRWSRAARRQPDGPWIGYTDADRSADRKSPRPSISA